MNEIVEIFVALLPGLLIALQLAAVTILTSYPLGLGLALLADSPLRSVRYFTVAVIELGRGIPLLVLLYLIYRGLPQMDIFLDPFPAAVIAFIISFSAYSAEMIRSSLHAVPAGQRAAATALGLSAQDAFFSVVLPQASRVAIPPLMNLGIKGFQLTSLAYAITLPEVMQAAYLYASTTFEYLQAFAVAALLYAGIAMPLSALVRALERRLGRHLI